MLLTLMMNLNMFGGNVPPPPIENQSGDGVRKEEAYKDDETRQLEIIKKRKDEEQIALMGIQWLLNYN